MCTNYYTRHTVYNKQYYLINVYKLVIIAMCVYTTVHHT